MLHQEKNDSVKEDKPGRESSKIYECLSNKVASKQVFRTDESLQSDVSEPLLESEIKIEEIDDLQDDLLHLNDNLDKPIAPIGEGQPVLQRKRLKAPKISSLKRRRKNNFDMDDYVVRHEYEFKVKKGNVCKLNCLGKRGRYIKVPRDISMLKIWRFCLRNPDIQRNDLLCTEHFLMEDIIKTSIYTSSVGHIGRVKDHVVPTSKRRVTVGCAIAQCINKNKNTANMYPIPIWREYSPWLRLFGELALNTRTLYEWLEFRVCERHFSEQNLKNVLHLVPTLHLPSRDYHDELLEDYLQKRGEVYERMITEVERSDYCVYLGCNVRKTRYSYNHFQGLPVYDQAIDWLKACNRSDILQEDRSNIEKFINYSAGLCSEHMWAVKKKLANNKNVDSARVEKVEHTKVELSKIPDSPLTGKKLANIKNVVSARVEKVENTNVKLSKIPESPRIGNRKVSSPSPTSFEIADVSSQAQEQSERDNLIIEKRNIQFSNKENQASKQCHMPPISPTLSNLSPIPSWDRDSPSPNNEPTTPETRCVVKYCTSTINTNTFFPFPDRLADRERFLQWVRTIENTETVPVDLVSFYARKEICNRHFERRYQVRTYVLRDDAVPTLNLIDDSSTAVEDTDAAWKECETDEFDMDIPDPSTPCIKGNAILRYTGIEFPNLRRELRCGRGCKRWGSNKYPFKIYRMTKRAPRATAYNIIRGHKLQIHTAIIIDDDDASEKEAIKTVSKILQDGPLLRNVGSVKTFVHSDIFKN